METKKLERIIILILALLNLFLLLVVLADWSQERSSKSETRRRLTLLLEAEGIRVGDGAELLQSCPAQCTVVRDLEMERRRVRGILGEHSAEDLGGSIWFYASSAGQMRIRGTGEMDLLLTGGGAYRGQSPEQTARALLAAGGIPLVEDSAWPQDPEAGLSLCCAWNGFPVYNAVLRVDYSRDKLDLLTGTVVFNRETALDAQAGMDSVSVLTRFLDLVRREELPCSVLLGISPGYYQSVAVSGEGVLTPVWRIHTDSGDYDINAVTGRPENLS